MRWPVTASPAWVARAALMTVALALGACQSGTATRPQVSSPPPAAPATGERYVIDARRSEVLVLVYRDGPMASLGHNHVIAVRQLSGLVVVAGELDRSHWQLDFPVDALSVDEPQLRAAQGEEFRTTLGDAAIAGTRAHMLGAALLDAASFPVIHLESEQILPGDDGLRLVVSIVVRDHSARIDRTRYAPAHGERTGRQRRVRPDACRARTHALQRRARRAAGRRPHASALPAGGATRRCCVTVAATISVSPSFRLVVTLATAAAAARCLRARAPARYACGPARAATVSPARCHARAGARCVR
jgi:hypothetical protein